MNHSEPTPPNQSAPTTAGEQRPLLSNAFYAVVGNGCYHVCQLGIVVLLAKFATPVIQGQYFLALAIVVPIILFCGLELRGALVADAVGQFPVGAYLSLRRRMLVPATILLSSVLVGFALTGTATGALLLLGGVFAMRLLWSWSEVGWGTFQRRERLDLLAATMILRGGVTLLPFTVLLPLATHGVLANLSPQTATGFAAVLAAVGVAVVWALFDRPRVYDATRWDLGHRRGQLSALLWQTLPLGIVALVINLCDSVPRLVLEGQPDGTQQLGYFGALAHITLAGNLFITQVATAAANRLARSYQTDLPAFWRLGGRLIILALAIGAAFTTLAFLCGHWILRVLYTPDYAAYTIEFQIVVIAQSITLLTNVLGIAATHMRLFRIQVPAQMLTLAATTIAAVILIPRDPIRGAAWTLLARAGVQLVGYVGCVTWGLATRDPRGTDDDGD